MIWKLSQQQTEGFSSGAFVAALTLAVALLMGCHSWSEFGDGPGNPHRSEGDGPAGGLSSSLWLHPFGSTATTHGAEVGMLTDGAGDYFVASYNGEIHVYDPSGTFQVAAAVPSGVGSRAVPYLVDDLPKRKTTIFAGSEGGGFHVIEIDKNTLPYTATVMATAPGVGVSESSPKRASSGEFYIAEQWGDVHRFHYNFSMGVLIHAATYSLGERVAGGIAVYDADPGSPGDEILVATQDGGFHVLNASLGAILWSETTGYGTGGTPHDEYYGGVTVALRGAGDPLALLPMAAMVDPASPNTGRLRAINLTTRSIAWEMTPSHTLAGVDQIPGSISVLHPFWQIRPGLYQVFEGARIEDLYSDSLLVWTGPEDPNQEDQGLCGCITRTETSEPVWPEGFVPDFNNPAVIVSRLRHWATFASTDGYVYGVDLMTGNEVWDYKLSTQGMDTPVTDRANVVYVGDGASNLHAVVGGSGAGLWTDPLITASATGAGTIVKLGITYREELVVGSGVSAYILK